MRLQQSRLTDDDDLAVPRGPIYQISAIQQQWWLTYDHFIASSWCFHKGSQDVGPRLIQATDLWMIEFFWWWSAVLNYISLLFFYMLFNISTFPGPSREHAVKKCLVNQYTLYHLTIIIKCVFRENWFFLFHVKLTKFHTVEWGI